MLNAQDRIKIRAFGNFGDRNGPETWSAAR